jgi:hypothetical protein
MLFSLSGGDRGFPIVVGRRRRFKWLFPSGKATFHDAQKDLQTGEPLWVMRSNLLQGQEALTLLISLSITLGSAPYHILTRAPRI